MKNGSIFAVSPHEYKTPGEGPSLGRSQDEACTPPVSHPDSETWHPIEVLETGSSECDPGRKTQLDVTLARIGDEFARLLRRALEGLGN